MKSKISLVLVLVVALFTSQLSIYADTTPNQKALQENVLTEEVSTQRTGLQNSEGREPQKLSKSSELQGRQSPVKIEDSNLNINFKLTDENGKEIDGSYFKDGLKGFNFITHFTLNHDNFAYEANDYFYVDIPEFIDLDGLSGLILSETGIDAVAKYTYDKDKHAIKVVLTEQAENYVELDANFTIRGNLSKELVEKPEEHVIKNPYTDETLIVLDFGPETPFESVVKEGPKDLDGRQKRASFEVKLNQDTKSKGPMKIKDSWASTDFSSSLVKVDTQSIKAYEMVYDLNSRTYIKDETKPININPNDIIVAENGFEVSLGNQSGPVSIIYDLILDDAIYQFNDIEKILTNTVQFNKKTASEDTRIIDRNVTHIKDRSKRVSSVDLDNLTIGWSIAFDNEPNNPIKPMLRDTFDSEGMSLVRSSFMIVERDTNRKLVENEDYMLNIDAKGFEIEFLKTSDASYDIHYLTQVEKEFYNPNATYSNTVSYGERNQTSQSSGWFNQNGNIRKEGRIITREDVILWTVKGNVYRNTASTYSMYDKIPEGLNFVSGSETVTYKGKILNAVEDYTLSFNEKKNTLDLTLNKAKYGIIDEEIILDFKTSFDRDTVKESSFENFASESWTDTHGKEHNYATSAVVGFDGLYMNRGHKYGHIDHQTKRIQWIVNVNLRNQSLKEAKLTDTLPKGLILNLDSIKVTDLDVTHAESDYSETIVNTNATVTLTKNQFKVKENKDGTTELSVDLGQFKNGASGSYQIAYETSYDGQLVPENGYTNKARYETKDMHDTSYKNTYEDTVHNKYGKQPNTKEAIYNSADDILTWTALVNGSGATITHDFKVTDVLSSNQVFIKKNGLIDFSTFDVYEVNYSDANGKIDTSTLSEADKVDPMTYNVEIGKTREGLESFTFTFKDTNRVVSKPLVFVYKTLPVFDSLSMSVTNKINVTGSNNEVETSMTVESKDKVIYDSSGSAGTKQLDMTVTKVDAVTNKPLEGVEFVLYRKNGALKLLAE